MSSRKRYHKSKNSETPKKWFKRVQNKIWKNIYKQQFNRWRSNPDFEIIEQTRPTSAKWEWNQKNMKTIKVTSLINNPNFVKCDVAVNVSAIKDIPWIRLWERNFLFHSFCIDSEGPSSSDGNTYTLMVKFASGAERYKKIATINGATDEEILKVFHIFEG